MKARRVIITAVVVVMTAMLGSGTAGASGRPHAAASEESPQRIRFNPGATSGTVTGTLATGGAAPYVFHARAGQTARVSFEAPPQVNWALVDPDGQPLKTTMGEQRNVTIELYNTGDHDLWVSSATPGWYRLRLEILPPLSSGSRVQRIRFAPGGTSTVVTGVAGEGVHTRYVFWARAGQVAHVRIASPTGDANWALTGPDGQPLKRMASEARRGVVTLPATGDYRLAIGAPQPGTAYRLSLRIPVR